MKIPKYQTAWGKLLNDNTYVLKPLLQLPIKRKLNFGELLLNINGEQLIVKSKNELLLQDNRSSKSREDSHKKSTQFRKQELEKSSKNITTDVAGILLERTLPSYWIEQILGENLSGSSKLALDLAFPYALGKLNYLGKTSKLFSKQVSSGLFINLDGTINTLKALPEIVRGKQFTIDYLNSSIRQEVNAHNKQLADRLEFKLFKPFDKAGERVSTPSNLKIINDKTSTVGGSVSTDSRNPALDLVTINLSGSNPYFASMHESLHRGYLGNAPKEYFLNETRGTFEDTNRFYTFLKDKVLKPWSERYNLPGADYLDNPAELAVNMLEMGLRMGLKIGQKYPGKQQTLDLLHLYRNSGDYKSGVIDHLNLNKPKRVWRGLTGTLFTSLPVSYGIGSNSVGLENK